MRAPRRILALCLGSLAVGLAAVLALASGLGAVSADSCTPPGVIGALGTQVCPPPTGGGRGGGPAPTGVAQNPVPVNAAPPPALVSPNFGTGPSAGSGTGSNVHPDIGVVTNTGGAQPESAGAQASAANPAVSRAVVRPPAQPVTVLPATGGPHPDHRLPALPIAALALGGLLLIAGAFLRRDPIRR